MTETATEAPPLAVGNRVYYTGNTVGQYQEPHRVGWVGEVIETPAPDQVRVTWDDGHGTSSVFSVNVGRVLDPRAFIIGQRYRVTRNYPQGAEVREGETVQCVRVTPTGSGRFQTINTDDVPDGREWIIHRDCLDPLVTTVTVAEAFEPVMVAQADHDRIVASLQEQVAAATARADAAEAGRAAALTRWQGDIQHIGQVLMNEADSRDWCEDYDSIVDRINLDIRYELPIREHTHSFTRRVEVTVIVEQTGTYTGRESDQDEIEEDSVDWPEIETSHVVQATRNGSWEIGETVDDSFENA